MTELEDRLRAMLHDRATDIDGPAALATAATAAGVADIASARRRGHRPRAWLLSAAALAVVATGLGALLVGTDGSGPDDAPVGTASSAVPAVDPAVSLERLHPAAVAKYAVRATGSYPTYSAVAWHRVGDIGRGPAADTGSAVSVQAVVLDAGRFPERLLTGRSPVHTLRIDAAKAFLLDLPQFRSGRPEGPDAVPSLAWEFASDRWAVVQKITDVVTAPELERLARALHPADTVPATVPFRLRTLPPGRLVESSDNRPFYPQTLVFRDGTTTTRIQIHPEADRLHKREDWIAHYVSGLAGYLDTQDGGLVEYAGGILTISAQKAGGALDMAVVTRIFAGLRWSGGDGSGPGVPLADALGG